MSKSASSSSSSMQHQASAPSSQGGNDQQREDTSDLVYITYNNRQLALGWSPSLEGAKATACKDLGLSEKGCSSKDIAFLFHPNNDSNNPLTEIMPSAWPKLRPLPQFQLVIRSEEEQHNSSHNSNVTHQQHVPEHVIHRQLRNQASNLTNSGKSQKSRGSDLTNSNSNITDPGVEHGGRVGFQHSQHQQHGQIQSKVDIEIWRRNQAGHPSALAGQVMYQHQESQHNVHQQIHQRQHGQVPLPQHALPSPPMSDAQSHRALSPPHNHSSPSSPASHHSYDMEVDDQIQQAYQDHYDEHFPVLQKQQREQQQQDATTKVISNTGFLAQTGRRTTVHFPHPEPLIPTSNSATAARTISTLATPDYRQMEIVAPQPIRRSHSQELLNRDYNHLVPSDRGGISSHQEQPSGPPVDAPVQMESFCRRPQAQQPQSAWNRSSISAKHQHPQSEESAVNTTVAHKGIQISTSASSRNTPSSYNAHPPAKQLPKPSSLRHSWDSNMPNPSADPYGSGMNRGLSDMYETPISFERTSGHRKLDHISSTMQRSPSHSHLQISGSSTGSNANRALFSGFDDMLSYPNLPEMPKYSPGNLASGTFGPRRASVPDIPHRATLEGSLSYPRASLSSNWSTDALVTLSAVTTPADKQKKRASTISRAKAFMVDVDMGNEISSDSEEKKARLEPRLRQGNQEVQQTPKRAVGTKTLRRLKSSPSGLAEQYNRSKDLEDATAPLFMDSDHSPPSPPLLTALSTKRGPTSWPNSPVKRNASLFSSASFSSTFASESGERKTLRNSVSMCIPPPPHPHEVAAYSSAKPIDSGTSSLLPPPPPFMTRSDNDNIDQNEAMRESSKSSGVLSPFLLFDKRRPDSPMPPIFRSLPPSPQALSMSTQDFSSRHNQQDARSVASFVGGGLAPLPTSKEGGYGPLSSYRGKASQSAEDLLALASSGPIYNPVRTPYTAPPPLPKSRSQVNFGSSPTNTTSPRNVRSRTYHGRVW